ncbi:MAG: competence/damage-inducible protein A [Ignavibacteria bacterium]|nr:MAG: competence/damage-inducible protein A [Ignavibacteria bacterium]
MNAYLISIGDELLIGQTINTNASFIADKLADINVMVIKIATIGDIESSILAEFKYGLEQSDIVIVTGGLGPTHDDITRTCVVKFFETDLVENEEVLENIKALFAKKKRELTDINKAQALVPAIATPIKNYHGTAPGMWIEKDKKIFIVMPGVPYEMKSMMNEYVIPNISEQIADSKKVIKRYNIQTTGIPESYLYEKLGDLDELLEGAKLAFLPSLVGVKLRITVEADDVKKAKNKILEIEQKIRTKVGRFIFGRDDDTLEGIVGKLLKERDLKISTAESCTGGFIAHTLTNVNGSSSYFERGVVCYSNASKVEILRVNEDVLIEHGSVSREVAMQMAEGVKSTSGSDIGIAVTGIMGPTGATTDKPVGLVYIGYCDDKVCTGKKFNFGNERLLNKQRTTWAALNMVRKQLLGIALDE